MRGGPMRIGELRVASAVAGLFVLLDDFAIRIWCYIMFSSVLVNQRAYLQKLALCTDKSPY